MSNFLNKNFVINFFIILSIFSLDRFTKVYVISENEKNLSSELFVSKFLNINLIYNEGIAFGLLSFDQSHLYNILTILIAAVILIIFFMTLKSDGFKKYSLLMIFGGALGNLYDRIFFKAVPDFIDFHIGNFHWFIFNVSDIFISLGVLFLKQLIIKKIKLMKKIFKLTIIIISILALNSCGTVREGFSSQKKNSIDEFLVEKKSPLVMPPDFNELPLPQQTNQATENEKNTDIKSLLTDNKDIDLDNQNTNQNTNFENSILEKIKNN